VLQLLGCCLHAPGQQKAPGVYGMSFCQALSDKFSFHMYHNTLQTKETSAYLLLLRLLRRLLLRA